MQSVWMEEGDFSRFTSRFATLSRYFWVEPTLESARTGSVGRESGALPVAHGRGSSTPMSQIPSRKDPKDLEVAW